MPTPTLLPRPKCDPVKTKDCYGFDATWTIVKTSGISIPSNSVNIPSGSATLLAVSTTLTDSNPPRPTTLWPPPAVEVSVGQRVRIVLVNNIPDEKVTLHFHGVLMDGGYSSMDGPEMVTQCGVNRGSFVYDFVANDAGTYWIHSHDPGQYPKGLRSPFIVKDTEGDNSLLRPLGMDYKDSDDKTVALSDWWQNFWDSEAKYEETPVAGNPCAAGVEVVPQGVLFNDYVPGLTDPGLKEYAIAPSFETRPVRTRFRFINMSAYSQFFIMFEQHRVTPIEVDGVLINPTGQLTEGFTLAPGQRLSVIVHSMANPGTKPFRILVSLDPQLAPSFPEKDKDYPGYCTLPNRAEGLTLFSWGCLSYSGFTTESCTAPSNPLSISMLTYDPGPSPATRKWFHRRLRVPWKAHTHTDDAFPWNFDERTFRPLTRSNGKTVTKEQLLSVQPGNVHWLRIRDMPEEKDRGNRGFGTMNTDLWNTPSFPGLLQATWRNLPPSEISLARKYGTESNSIMIPDSAPGSPDPVVWLVFNTSNGDHPMHLHGHHFHLLYKGRENDLSANMYHRAITEFNSGNISSPYWTRFRDGIGAQLDNGNFPPMARDTLMAERYQFLVIAFVADNPGVWALHCHNDFHAKTGMFKQIVERPGAIRDRLGTWEVDQDKKAGLFYEPAAGGMVSPVGRGGWERNVLQCLDEGKVPFVSGV
ncbi:multicopper oxidase [Podospora aff. communis PSN243]|uniref:Multicopper oxidase n=1 Tax=Podospora aff. communis PSN243 TaxID=3040156 RepID=A0AAV9GV86_9PEZI|nr:multicopper oxidase [Podospora aff. communis PSN243]